MRFFKRFLALSFFLNIPFLAVGQIGIGTLTPDASALMDIRSQNQGILTPRMNTAQRNAIDNPANGLLVFDTDLSAFYFYNKPITSWERMSSRTRDNYVLVKRQADFPAPSGGTITLNEDTYYEINGTVTLNASINLNGAYVSGLDAPEDVLSFPGGTIFKGIGGSIRNVTLMGGRAFDINGGNSVTGGSFLLQNSIVSNMTSSVGTIQGLGLVFTNNVQYLNNENGITFSNIRNLLVNNQAWLESNKGTYEKINGVI